MKHCITLLEGNERYRTVLPGEPQMGRRGLYPATGVKHSSPDDVRGMMNVIAFADGRHDVVDLCDKTGLP